MHFTSLALAAITVCVRSVAADTLYRYDIDCTRVDGYKGLYSYKELEYQAYGIGGPSSGVPLPVPFGTVKICLDDSSCPIGFPSFSQTINGHTYKYSPNLFSADHYSLDGNDRAVPTKNGQSTATDSYCNSICSYLGGEAGTSLQVESCSAFAYYNLDNLS